MDQPTPELLALLRTDEWARTHPWPPEIRERVEQHLVDLKTKVAGQKPQEGV